MGARSVVMIEQGGRGGVADYTGQLVRALAADGWSVELVTASDHLMGDLGPGVRVRPYFTYFRGGTRWRDAIRRVQGQKAINGLRLLVMTFRLLPAARRAGTAHLQGHEVPIMDIMLLVLLRVLGVRVVQTPHNTFGRAGERRGMRWMLGLPHALIVHTRWDVGQLPEAVRPRTHVIPHGDYGPLAAATPAVERGVARAALGLPAEATVALCFGQLRRDKGLDDVLAAAREVPGLHVVLAGEDVGALAGLATPLADPGLRGRVHVHAGYQTIEQTARLFAACDVTVLAYRHASMSGVLLLAYGFGRPVLAYPVGGLPEAIRPGETGWLSGSADVPALAASLREVAAADPAESARRGANGRALAAREYAWSTVAAQTAGLYRQA